MKNIIRFFIKLFLFLLLLFFVQRVVFVVFRLSELKNISLNDILLVFSHGLPMDVATACAVLIVPFLFFSVTSFVPKLNFHRPIKFWILIVIIFSSFITICDIALYEVWGTRINSKAISYLSYPKEAVMNIWSMHYIFLFMTFLVLIFLFGRFSKKYFQIVPVPETKLSSKILFIILIPFILIIGIRGGFQKFPLGKSSAYFSPHAILNQAALNGTWNFCHLLSKPFEMNKNPYRFFKDKELKTILEELNEKPDASVMRILNCKKPNIILIMLESWSVEIIEPLGGRKGITPEFSSLTKEGLLFTNFYSPGFRTEQGLAALVSGFPAQPQTSIIQQYGKFDRLPGLPRALSAVGYTSSYYYGGNLHFANTDGYLAAMGFSKTFGETNFNFKTRSGWGYYDEDIFNFFNDDLKNEQQPFFSILMSSTSHEPFDGDVEKIVPEDPSGWCDDYINTIHYSDKCLGKLIDELKKQIWYNHTLIAIVADHGNSCPDNNEYNSEKRHHIPFLLIGGALSEEWKGKTFSRISSQVDFPASILSLLELPHDDFHWSKNIFDSSSPQYVFYSFDDGFGWLNERQQIIFDNKQNRVISVKNNSVSASENDRHLNYGKAYLQILMDEYIGLNGK